MKKLSDKNLLMPCLPKAFCEKIVEHLELFFAGEYDEFLIVPDGSSFRGREPAFNIYVDTVSLGVRRVEAKEWVRLEYFALGIEAMLFEAARAKT